MVSTNKRLAGLVLASVLGFGLVAAAPAWGATARASGNLPVRNGPGTLYATLGHLANNERVEVVRCTRGSNWCYIDAGNLEGWVRGSYLVGSPAKAAVTPPTFNNWPAYDLFGGWHRRGSMHDDDD